MVAIVLVHPEIPPNTGNVIRLAANTGAELHLVEPLGFRLEDRELRRAGLDYHEFARVLAHRDWAACRAAVDPLETRRWYALTTKGPRSLFDCALRPDEVFVFGCETAGLPAAILAEIPADAKVRISMRAGARAVHRPNA